MKRVIYAGSHFVTGDEIAAALMRYSEALAEVGQAETVTVPAVDEDGSRTGVLVLVGPASQIMAQDIATELDEFVDPEAVAYLEAKTRRLTPRAVLDTDPPPVPEWEDDSSADAI